MPALELPFDVSRTPATPTQLESHTFALIVPVLDAMPGATPETLLAAVFGIELARYNGQPSIPLSASRLTVAGLVLWTSPLCLQTAVDTTCRDLLTQLGELFSRPSAQSPGHAAGGGHAALTWLEPGHGDDPPDVLKILGQSTSSSRDADLHLVIMRDGDRATFVYNASLFKRASIERFAGHLGVLLAHVVSHLDVPISRLPLLVPAEQQWLDAVSHGRTRSFPTELVHQLIELRAAATPEAIAARFRDQSLTYLQLNRQANRLARYLVSRGIGAECRVVVCVEPAFDILIALLGILKAGAVYVPLDPSYPVARIRAILDDTQPTLVISRAHLIDRLAFDGVALLALDASEPLLDGFDGENPNTAIVPEQTAYIYYTSGTTGTPKGVMASQANLMAYLQVAQDRYAFSSRDVMPAIARFSFSISMFELMSPLVAGGTLIILEREHILDMARMAGTLRAVTLFHAGPSLLKNLLAYIKRHHSDSSAFSGVRHASSGGDMIAPQLLDELNQIFFNAEVFVIYGCSEISCMGCTYLVPRDPPPARTYVGRPFDNMVVRVLDRALNPVPVGVTGEIHFAGAGIVKGYLNRSDLTAEKFITIDGRRFYCTGDLGRLSEDGCLEVLGRNDFQIKVRGMRIELGDVEHTLRSAPCVRDGAVVARPTASGDKALVAYVVLDCSQGAPDEATRPARMQAIRRHMTDHLPDYMVPATYVELASMPLNHNKKLDRNALPEPARVDHRETADPRVRDPDTPTERRLASLWKKLLRVEHVGLDDNFFELGGDSLLAMELILELEGELHIVVDGMDVLRESLEVQATICDQRLGKPIRTSGPRAPATPAGEVVTTFHFGHEQSLYGVLHMPAAVRADEVVLVCSPVGQERVRTHFVLSRLARQLAARGVPVLHFDYYGCFDSLGESTDATCARWQRDIADAYDELKRRTDAARVVGIGVRLGATLLCNAWGRLGLDVSKLVLWDPVCEGATFYAEMTQMHRTYLHELQYLRLGRPPKRTDGAQELMGSTYSHAALRELKELAISPGLFGRQVPIKWLVTSQPTRQRSQFLAISGARAECRIEALDVDCRWYETAEFGEILPDVGIARALAAMVTEKT